MKNVAHTHIHATQAQYAKSALKKLRLASLAPWAVAALSLVGTVAQAAQVSTGPITVKLQADMPASSCTITGTTTTLIDLSTLAKVSSGITFDAWTTNSSLNNSINATSLGSFRGNKTFRGGFRVECAAANQKITSIDIVNHSQATQVGLSTREQYLKDSNNVTAFSDGKVAAFLIDESKGTTNTINHAFHDVASGGTGAEYTNNGAGITLSTTTQNGKYFNEFTWTPIFAATGTNLITNQAYTGTGQFFGYFQVNINY